MSFKSSSNKLFVWFYPSSDSFFVFFENLKNTSKIANPNEIDWSKGVKGFKEIVSEVSFVSIPENIKIVAPRTQRKISTLKNFEKFSIAKKFKVC